MQQLLKPQQAAATIGVTAGRLGIWRCEGIGPPYFKLNGGHVRYGEDDLKAWLIGQRVETDTRTKLQRVK